MSVQIITQNGQPEWAVIPYAEYIKMIEETEMMEDIQDYDAIKEAIHTGNEELLPANLIFGLAEGENPLKTWREFRGLTQHQLADRAGVSVPFISQLEAGKRKSSVGVLVKFATILKVDVNDLIVK